MSDHEHSDTNLTRREFLHTAVTHGALLSSAAGILAAGTDGRADSASSFLPGSDWPMYRHDPALTAQTPLKGGLATAPQSIWSIDLGGPKVAAESVALHDVTGDGQVDLLILGIDSVTCRDSLGKLLWKADDLLNPVIAHVLDFAGDGSRGILLSTSRAGQIDTYLINGGTGKVTHLWRDQNNFGGHTRVGKLLPGVAGLQIAVTASGQTPPEPQGGDVRLVSFEAGIDQPNFRIRQHLTGVVYSPLLLFADLDADGEAELVVISHEQVWTFDTQTGQRKLTARYSGQIRTYYATIAAVKLNPNDKFLSLVMINPHLPGLKVISQDGATFAKEHWKVVIGGLEDQYQKHVTVGPAGPDLLYDLHRDGRYLIFVSVKNEHHDGATSLVIFDAKSGHRVQELPSAQILSVDDLDGDEKLELLLQRGTDLLIARWHDDQLQTIHALANVTPLLRPLPLEGTLSLYSGNSPNTKGNRLVWRESEGSKDFLLQFPEGVFSCRLEQDGLKKTRAITTHEALSNHSPLKQQSEQIAWDGQKVITSVAGQEVYCYVVPTRTTYLAHPPIVADLEGSRRIVVRNADAQYVSYSPDGIKLRVLVEHPHEGFELITDPAGIGPIVCDVDGDGKNEILATVVGSDKRPACVIMSEDGQVKRRIELPPGLTGMARGPTGRLAIGRWILVRMSGEGLDHERLFRVVAFDGRTGQQMWSRDHYGSYGPNPVSFVAHFPSAVVDFDGDGTDDWLACSENFYGIIDVKANRDLVPNMFLSNAIEGHWTAYSFPTVGRMEPRGKPVVLHHGAFSLSLVADLEGRPLWHYGMTRDTGGTVWGQLVDLDGDGRAEVLHAQPDGLLRCFSAQPTKHCPLCPAETPKEGQGAIERWHLDLKRPISRLIAAELDNDGRMEVLFGCGDGKLYALGERDGKPQILWTVDLKRRVGEPVIADLDGDGRPEVLVATEDGQLHCLKCRA